MSRHLVFDGCDTVELAKQYGTPLYLMSESSLRERIGRIRRSFSDRYDNVMALYAGKAFLPMAMCALIDQEGMGLDVVSPGELFTAQSAGFPMEKIYFHGNNKTQEDLIMALDAGIGRFVVDSQDELELLSSLAEKKGKIAPILFRLTPGVKGETHKYIQTSHTDCKFGIPLVGDRLEKCVSYAQNSPSIDLKGFHFHVGSQLLDNSAYVKAVAILADLMAKFKTDMNYVTQELNIGGGIGIPSQEGQTEVDLESFFGEVMDCLESECRDRDICRPRIVIEPGRWIVGPSGVTLYSVGTVKEIPEIRTYVSVDGGMTDNPRPSLYQAKYRCDLANRLDEEKDSVVTVAGRCCESGDILIKDASIPTPVRGDILAIYDTGAYNFSMATNYNRLRRPAVVLVNDGQSEVIVERQSFEDLVKGETIPARFMD